jgi:putative ABC transport system permease protein
MTLRRHALAALGSIRRNAARSLLTVLGVVIGVASVVVMVAIGNGAEAQVAAQIAGLGSNLVVVTPGVDRKAGVSAGAGSMESLKVEDVQKLERESLEAAAVTPAIRTFSMAVAGGNNWRTPIVGVDVSYFDIRRWPVRSGRSFDELDVRNSRKVCVLGVTVAENLFGDEDPVGPTLRQRPGRPRARAVHDRPLAHGRPPVPRPDPPERTQ